MSRHRLEPPGRLRAPWLTYVIERAGLLAQIGPPGRLADVVPLPPIRHALEAGPTRPAQVIIHSPAPNRCILCQAEKCWRVVRSGDHAVNWACSEHLSPALDSLLWPTDDGRTVFTVVHHTEV